MGRGSWVIFVLAALVPVVGQELEPRSYSISPVGVNFVVAGFGRSSGDLSFDPTLPVEDAEAQLKLVVGGYARSLNFFGRSAITSVQVPYIWGPLQGRVSGEFQSIRRSGFGDPSARLAVNLWGAPAMDLPQFARYQQRTNIGASIIVVAPLGQYDPARLINPGSNRWAMKPEVGISRRIGRWYLDFYAGAWVFAANTNFQGRRRTQNPIGSSQIHISYNLTPRAWAAFDANFYTGGRTFIDGVGSATLQRNSRVGGTVSLPIGTRDSLKFTVSTGAVTTIGAAFTTVAVSYQHMWGGGLE